MKHHSSSFIWILHTECLLYMPGILSDAKNSKDSLKINSSGGGQTKLVHYTIWGPLCSIYQPNFCKTKSYLHFSTAAIQMHWRHTPETNSRKQDLLKAWAQKNLFSQVLKERNHSSSIDQKYPYPIKSVSTTCFQIRSHLSSFSNEWLDSY